jgi:hypothetical protein
MLTKQKVKVIEIESIGLTACLGERVMLMCANYFYEGVLEAIDETDAILSDVGIVYDTGKWDEIGNGWEDRQSLGGWQGIKLQSVESYRLTPPLVTP